MEEEAVVSDMPSTDLLQYEVRLIGRFQEFQKSHVREAFIRGDIIVGHNLASILN